MTPPGFRQVLVTEASHPYMDVWWPQGHIIGWEHTFVHELHHFLGAVVNNKDVGPDCATFEDGYRNAVICDAITEAARSGRRVRHKVLTDAFGMAASLTSHRSTRRLCGGI